MCIEEQFSPSAKVVTSLLGLVPSVLCSRNREFKQIATAGADTATGSKFPPK